MQSIMAVGRTMKKLRPLIQCLSLQEYRKAATGKKYWEQLVLSDFKLRLAELRPRPDNAMTFYIASVRAKRAQLRSSGASLAQAVQNALRGVSPMALMELLVAGNRHVRNAVHGMGF